MRHEMEGRIYDRTVFVDAAVPRLVRYFPEWKFRRSIRFRSKTDSTHTGCHCPFLVSD